MADPNEIAVLVTREYSNWIARVRDHIALAAIDRRVRRLRRGNFGDAKALGGGVTELRIDQGPGYRPYFTKVENVVVLFLCGGDKASQQRDIELAKRLAAQAKETDR